MYDEPYLESCCRSALHRLVLAGEIGRPDGLKDGRCLDRLVELGLARRCADRVDVTEAGRARHGSEVLRPSTAP